MSGSLEKRKQKYKNKDGEWIWDKAIEQGMDYKGFVDDIKPAFKRAKAVIDLSVGELGSKLGDGYRSLNYVPIEAMKYGAIPVVRKHSLINGMVTKDNVILVEEGDLIGETAKKVNEAVGNFDSYKDMIENNFFLLKVYHDRKENTSKILGRLQ
jgi:hypothetical protein